MNKSIFLSKTFWLQVVVVLSMLFPQAKAWAQQNPEAFASLWALANVLMRYITKGAVTLKGEDDAFLPMIIGLVCVALVSNATISCTPAQQEAAKAVPVRATYVDKKGNVYAYDPRTGVSIQIIESAK